MFLKFIRTLIRDSNPGRVENYDRLNFNGRPERKELKITAD